MAALEIPQHLVDLQRTENAAWDALTAYRQALGKTALEWDDADHTGWDKLTAARDAAAEARHAAVAAFVDAWVAEQPEDAKRFDSYTFTRTLHTLAKPEEAAADA